MILYLDLDQQVVAQPRCLGQGSRNTAGTLDVVFLDQHGIEQADAVILTAAASHRVFLRQPQAGESFSRVEDDRAGTVDGGHVFRGLRRGGGQCLQKIQRGALAAQQCARRSDNFADDIARLSGSCIADIPVDHDARVQLAKHLVSPGLSAQHQRLARNYRCADDGIRIHQRCRNIPGSEILRQRRGDRRCDRCACLVGYFHNGNPNSKKPGPSRASLVCLSSRPT